MRLRLLAILTLSIYGFFVAAQEDSLSYQFEVKKAKEEWCILFGHELSDSNVSELAIDSSNLKNIKISSFSLLDKNEKIVSKKLKLYVISAIDNKGRAALILDENLDLNFSNEKMITFPSLEIDSMIDYSEKFVYYPGELKAEAHINLKATQHYESNYPSKFLSFKPYAKYDSISNTLYYNNKIVGCLENSLVFEGELEGTSIRIATLDGLYYQKSLPLFLTKSDAYQNNFKFYLHDTVPISDDKAIVIDSIDYVSRKFSLKVIPYKDNPIQISEVSLFTDDTISLSTNNSYKIVHFWGSWCKPCIQNIPKLQKFNNTEIELFGVCTDYEKDMGKNMAIEKNMTWNNVYIDINKFEAKNQWNIQTWPTYLLLDKYNTVIVKTNNFEVVDSTLTSVLADKD